MKLSHCNNLISGLLLLTMLCGSFACRSNTVDEIYFGETRPRQGQILRYISGAEPESLDPQLPTGQSEARILMALFEGLVEYDPRTMEPIPAIAERWQVSATSSEYLFHLRRNACWSNGESINAHDFVYTFRRGISPQLAARNAALAYYIKYAEAYNTGGMFARDKLTNNFLLVKDFAEPNSVDESADAAARIVVAGDEKNRAAQLKANPKLDAALKNSELVAVGAEDIGVEAVDDYTVRITLTQPAPFFLGLLAHQFFRVVPRKAIEMHGVAWTQPSNIVTGGAFKLAEWQPYHLIEAIKNPFYWDADRVRLERILFYPLEEATTIMNLYKAGEVDAIYNHTVPKPWIDSVRQKRDYMDAPEAAIFYYCLNTKQPPMNDVRVRKAFNMAIDKDALAKFRVINKPLTAFTPEGVFANYTQPKGDGFNPQRARQLLAEAGYANSNGEFDASKFPVEAVEVTYNTSESNRQVGEFIQSQWKRNLGLTVPLKNVESKTFLSLRASLDYKGIVQGAWGADYIDPLTFLNLFYTDGADNATGWSDPAYTRMLDDANRTADIRQRYELLARAEALLLDAQPVIPLMTTATNWMKKPYVKGLYPNPGTLHAWKFVYIEHDPAKWEQEGKG